MGRWTAGEAQIVAALSRRPNALTHLVGALDALNADIGSYQDLDFGLRRLVASDYVRVEGRGFRLTKAGAAIARRGSKGVRGSRLLYVGIARELDAAGPPPAPAAWRLAEQEYNIAVGDYHARMEPFVRWLGMTWAQRLRHLVRRSHTHA